MLLDGIEPGFQIQRGDHLGPVAKSTLHCVKGAILIAERDVDQCHVVTDANALRTSFLQSPDLGRSQVPLSGGGVGSAQRRQSACAGDALPPRRSIAFPGEPVASSTRARWFLASENSGAASTSGVSCPAAEA